MARGANGVRSEATKHCVFHGRGEKDGRGTRSEATKRCEYPEPRSEATSNDVKETSLFAPRFARRYCPSTSDDVIDNPLTMRFARRSLFDRRSVVACDFYNAGGFMGVEDKEIVRVLMEELLPAAVPEFAGAKVMDSWVGKYGGAVSHFSPGSYKDRPSMFGDPSVPAVKFAGDIVKMGEREHAAKVRVR